MQYKVESDYVLEEVILYEYWDVIELAQKIMFEGVTPVETKGGISFANGERYLFGIPPPVMYKLNNAQCYSAGLHYELEVRDNSYYLKKVIDEEGLTSLKGDLDCDGVADSVDDDNTDPSIGDEDPDKP